MPLRTADPATRLLIHAVALKYALPPWRGFSGSEWLEAMVISESSGDPQARRYEVHLDLLSPDDADTPAHDDGDMEDDKSYGPMQVLGTNLRRAVGISGRARMNFAWATDFGVGLLMGVLHVQGLIRPQLEHEISMDVVVDRALARYNGGFKGNPREDGTLRTQVYVDKIRKNTELVHADRLAKGWTGPTI